MRKATDKQSRRQFIAAGLMAGGGLWLDLQALAKALPVAALSKSFANGKFIKVMPFVGEFEIPAGKLLGSGLDGRLYTDLSMLQPDTLVVPNDKFYVRTACPDLLDQSTPWIIQIKVAGNEVGKISAQTLQQRSKNMGLHLMECSGNGSGGQFGLMSACRWDGVPVLRMLESMNLRPNSKRICISGFDQYSDNSGTPGLAPSVPGASWIFTEEQLKESHAFFATKMNGQSLPADHGYPVRLLVPGWYGCACIKWVNEIAFVDDDAEATPHMKEFASRTQQQGVPQLARDYQPASMDQAAMPIRVEQWQVDGHSEYNVVGIMWGGHKPTRKLQICFSPNEQWLPVEDYHQRTNATWTLWSYRWAPQASGTYQIRLRVADPEIPTRRLDQGYYTRAVHIEAV